MTREELEAIKGRLTDRWYANECDNSRDDVAALVGEVERLRAVVQRYQDRDDAAAGLK